MNDIASRPLLAILAPLKNWGGLERKFLILCREFLNKGVQPELVLTRGGKVPYPDHFPSQVKVVDLRAPSKLSAIPKLSHYLRCRKPDVLLTAKDHAAKAGVIARKMSRTRTPLFIKVTNTLSQTVRQRIKLLTIRWLYPQADGIIAVSKGVKQDLVQELGIPDALVHVVYNPTLTPDMEHRSSFTVDHPWLPAGNPPVFLGVGRLTTQKDFSTLIKAFAQVRAQRNSKLIILGEGPEREHLNGLIGQHKLENDVHLPGHVQDPLPWMARVSAFVLSSQYEGLSNVLIEAMAMGTPLVATDCPSGSAEILENGGLGNLVPVGDVESLAHSMLQALDHPSSPHKLRTSAKRFQSDVIAQQYLQLMGLA